MACSLARRWFGETVEAITSSFPHWFAARFRDYAGREAALPVDQHLLLALAAPRPLYVASATEDLWADPRGEFLAAKAAEPVYRLLRREGLGIDGMPAPDRPVGGSIGYHLRRGPHALTAYDWEQYLAFADRHLRTAPAGAPGSGATPPLPGERARTRQAILDTAVATLFASVGLLSIAAGLRSRAGSAPWLALGAALVQHSLNQLAASAALRAALGGPLPMWIWVLAVTSYLIAVPWALLLE